MAIESMQLLGVNGKTQDFQLMAAHALNAKTFHPIPAQEIITSYGSGTPYLQERVFSDFLSRIETLKAGLQLELNEEYSTEVDQKDIESALQQAESTYQALVNTQTRMMLEDDFKAIEVLRSYPFKSFDEGYISVHFGRIPLSVLAKVTLYNNEKFVFTELIRNKHYVWITYVCLKEDEAHFDEMFSTLYFEPITIPSVTEDSVKETCMQVLNDIYGYVVHQAKIEAFAEYVSLFEERSVFMAFVPETAVLDFKNVFEDHFEVEVIENQVPESIKVPTRLHNHWLIQPFEMFIEMYGLPRYGTFDPTAFFAITYSLLFGIMFGDVGQGLVIALVGLYLDRKKKMRLGAVMARIGVFSMIFGFIYGSVFGNETLLEPLLEPLGLPIRVGEASMTVPLLLAAVAFGVALIVISMILNMIILIRQKRYEEAIISQNGLCGLIFYNYILLAFVLNIMGIMNLFHPVLIVLCVAVPLGLLLFKEPVSNVFRKINAQPEQGWGSYIIEGLFELLEVCLSFVTNTMSFLRVGGFVLSHVGMMTVVSQLQSMTGNASPVVFVLGNIIVIGLEGMIVGIQTLRLEYYELFSRYYESGGVRFESI